MPMPDYQVRQWHSLNTFALDSGKVFLLWRLKLIYNNTMTI